MPKARGGHKEDEGRQWRELVPVLYDWLCNHHLVWPSLSCRWGPQVEDLRFKRKQRLYLSEQTDGTVPNTLVVATVEVVKPRVAAAEHINSFSYDNRSPFVRKTKTIIHPGEVNRIRELPEAPHILATHTDSPEVFVWNTETQPNRLKKESKAGASLREHKGGKEGAAHLEESRPDLVLVGHTSEARFALAMGQAGPLVLSGGQDELVVLWNIEDQMTTLQTPAGADSKPRGARLAARGVYKGHTATVEDVQFRPSSREEFCSVGDDSRLLLWDARAGEGAVAAVERAHEGDLHCVDWNAHDENLILTGSADGQVKLFDRRSLETKGPSKAIHTFEGHSKPVLCVQWCPDRTSVFGSCAGDKTVNVWDSAQVASKHSAAQEESEDRAPEGLMFKHVGHRDEVVDFHWDPVDPWTIASVSVESSNKGGSALQLWRISDLIYRSPEEVLEELAEHRAHVLGPN